jgi:hypothetical protein
MVSLSMVTSFLAVPAHLAEHFHPEKTHNLLYTRLWEPSSTLPSQAHQKPRLACFALLCAKEDISSRLVQP